jgi:hypothetical protein
METTQLHGIPVIEFYTWSKTNGHTSSKIYVTMIGSMFVLPGQLAEEGFADPVPLNILARVKVTKEKMKELGGIAKRGH